MKKYFLMAVCAMAVLAGVLCSCSKDEFDVNITASHSIKKANSKGKFPVTFKASVTGCSAGDVDELCLYICRDGSSYAGSPAHGTLSTSKTVEYEYKQKVSYYAEVVVNGKKKVTGKTSFTVKK